MPAFLIPLAGLALGALGRLIFNRRSQGALNSASRSGSMESMTSETGLSTAASGSKPSTEQFGSVTSQTTNRNEGIGDKTPGATQPATGPVRQNQNTDSPTPSTDAGLAARLGRESQQASRKKNLDQQQVSNAALR